MREVWTYKIRNIFTSYFSVSNFESFHYLLKKMETFLEERSICYSKPFINDWVKFHAKGNKLLWFTNYYSSLQFGSSFILKDNCQLLHLLCFYINIKDYFTLLSRQRKLLLFKIYLTEQEFSSFTEMEDWKKKKLKQA